MSHDTSDRVPISLISAAQGDTGSQTWAGDRWVSFLNRPADFTLVRITEIVSAPLNETARIITSFNFDAGLSFFRDLASDYDLDFMY